MPKVIVTFNKYFGKTQCVNALASHLLALSESSSLITQEGTEHLTTLDKVRESIPNWPNCWDKPWILAGSLDNHDAQTHYEGPLTKDYRGKVFDTQVKALLDKFDWAIFDYFTTFQTSLFIFAANDFYEVDALFSKNSLDPIVDIYRLQHEFQECPYKLLRNASFYDHEAEGLCVLKLARSRAEASPYLLCNVEIEHIYRYYEWDEDRDDYIESLWFEEYFVMLEKVDEFKVKHYDSTSNYLLFKVNDEAAYLKIWSMASSDKEVACATLAADTDITRLKAYIHKTGLFDITPEIDAVCSWSYCHIYGGGADEYHGVFRSRDAGITDELWESLGEARISRF